MVSDELKCGGGAVWPLGWVCLLLFLAVAAAGNLAAAGHLSAAGHLAAAGHLSAAGHAPAHSERPREEPRGRPDELGRASRAELDRLERQLREPRPERRRRAVAGLAQLGGDRAMAGIVRALSDRSGEVADEAQLQLPGLAGAGLLALLRKHKGLADRAPLVRLRWAELIGRCSAPLPARDLASLLGVRGADERRALFWSVERLGRMGLLAGNRDRLVKRVLGGVRGGRDTGCRAAALQALVHLDPGRAETFIWPWIKGGDRALGCSAVMAAVELGLPAGATLLEAAMGHEDWGVRLRAIELARGSARDLAGAWSPQPARSSAGSLVGPDGERASRVEVCVDAGSDQGAGQRAGVRAAGGEDAPSATLGLLLGRLRVEPRRALRGALVGSLRELTGLRHRDHVASWEAAIRALPPDWVPASTSRASAGAQGRKARQETTRGTVAALGRLDPMSDRLAILVDFSGSLWIENAEGRCKKDRLDPEVTRLLSGFGAGTEFLLVPYTKEPHPFEPRLVEATGRNVRRAQRFFTSARMNGSGDLFEALGLALDAPGVDRVVLLTDGAPSGGERWDVDLMVTLLKERLRFRPALLDFVLVDSSRKLERAWGGLASSTGGRLILLGW